MITLNIPYTHSLKESNNCKITQRTRDLIYLSQKLDLVENWEITLRTFISEKLSWTRLPDRSGARVSYFVKIGSESDFDFKIFVGTGSDLVSYLIQLRLDLQ